MSESLLAENLEASEHLVALASRYRRLILTELTGHYTRTIGKERGTARLGVILCLLQEFRVCHTRHRSCLSTQYLILLAQSITALSLPSIARHSKEIVYDVHTTRAVKPLNQPLDVPG